MRSWLENAYTAVQSEMKQLHFRNTFKLKHWRELTNMQHQTVLESNIFLKEKIDGAIKVRAVAGGKKLRNCISKEYARYPIVATEAVLLSCIIGA